MKRWLWTLTAIGVALAACAPPAASPVLLNPAAAPKQENPMPAPLPDGPVAPELTNQMWLNSEPLGAADLRGNVVLIDFWTFG